MPLAKAQRAQSARGRGRADRRACAPRPRSSAGSSRSRSPGPASSTCACAPRRASASSPRCWPPAPPSARAAAERRAGDGRVRLGQPDRAAARRPRAPGRARRRDLQPARDAGPARHARVLLQRRRRADRDAGGLGRRRASTASSRATPAGPSRPTTATTSPTSPPTSSPERPCTPTTASSPPPGDVDDLDGIRQFAVAYLRHEQDLDLQAFGVRFDNYYLESSLYTSGRVEATVRRLVAAGKTYEEDGALWLRTTDYGDDKDRVMRKSDGTLHLLRARRRLPPRQVRARLHQGDQHPGHRPPRHDRARARRPAGGRRRHAGGLPRLRAAHDGARRCAAARR